MPRDNLLPRRLDSLACAHGEIPQRRSTRDGAAQQFDAALASHRNVSIEMRGGIAVADLDDSRGRPVSPAQLNKVHVIDLGLTGKSFRENERRSQAVPHQSFQARGDAATRKVDARAAV